MNIFGMNRRFGGVPREREPILSQETPNLNHYALPDLGIMDLPGLAPIGIPDIEERDFIDTVRTPEESGITPALIEAVTKRKDANEALNNATDQYEADVADYKDILATEAEQGIASLPSVDSRPDFKKDVFNTRTFIGEHAPEIEERSVIDTVRENGVIQTPSADTNVYTNIVRGWGAPKMKFTEPSPTNWRDMDERDFWDSIDEEPPWDPRWDSITDDPPYIDLPPILPYDPPEPKGPINIYTGKPVRNPYQPYSTESGATPLLKAISPSTFGQAPGFIRPPAQPDPIIPPPRDRKRPPIIQPDRDLTAPDVPPELRPIAYTGPSEYAQERRLLDSDATRKAKHGMYLSNSPLNKGIGQLPTTPQQDTLTTQIFQRGFRPRR